jgi:hypothetical protein
MRISKHDSRPSLPARLHELVTSQKVGVSSAFVSAGLLAIGSFMADRMPQLYAGLSGDDLRFFFHPWRLAHFWLYGLFASMSLWALSTLLCTWDTIVARVRGRVVRLSAWGTILVHTSFCLALLAHLWAGFASETREHVVDSGGTEIAGAVYRVRDIDQSSWPSGMPRKVTVSLERTRGAEVTNLVVGYNEPIVLEAGARELLLGRFGQTPGRAVLRVHGEQVTLRPGDSYDAGAEAVTLLKLHTAQALRVPVVSLSVGQDRIMLPLDPSSREDLAFVDVEPTWAVSLQERHNPSVPLVLVVAGLLMLGVVLVGWERVRRARSL